MGASKRRTDSAFGLKALVVSQVLVTVCSVARAVTSMNRGDTRAAVVSAVFATLAGSCAVAAAVLLWRHTRSGDPDPASTVRSSAD